MLEGGFGRTAVDETRGGRLGCDEVGRYRCGICVFNDGSKACNSVKSRVVEYLSHLDQKSPTKAQ